MEWDLYFEIVDEMGRETRKAQGRELQSDVSPEEEEAILMGLQRNSSK